MNPKPLVKFTPKRLERYAVTIIAGFSCSEGIVVCADTQETISHSKRHVSKLRYEFGPGQAKGQGLAAAFCGAGYGPFIDKLVDQAWKEAEHAKSLDEASELIAQSIENSYEKYGRIYQVGQCPSVELIYGVKMNGRSSLFSADGPIVNEKERYHSSGAGYYMADFLASRMYGNDLDIHQCVILAAYILFQAKEHVDGCGGDSQIAVLRDDGSSGPVDSDRVKAMTEVLQLFDAEFGRTLLSTANLELDDKGFRERFNLLEGVIKSIREQKREDIEARDRRHHIFRRRFGGDYKTDALGLPIIPEDSDD
jgi:20S proteasome alpha/beta subunit